LHIKRVSELLNEAAIELLKRANKHDASKLLPPEKELFDEFTPNTKDYINFPLPTKTLEEIKDWISEIFEKSNNKKEE
jgi:hypothetical protein